MKDIRKIFNDFLKENGYHKKYYENRREYILDCYNDHGEIELIKNPKHFILHGFNWTDEQDVNLSKLDDEWLSILKSYENIKKI